MRLQIIDNRNQLAKIPQTVQQKILEEVDLWTIENGPLKSAIKTVMMKPEFFKTMEHELLSSEDVLGTIYLMNNKKIDQYLKSTIKDVSLRLQKAEKFVNVNGIDMDFKRDDKDMWPLLLPKKLTTSRKELTPDSNSE